MRNRTFFIDQDKISKLNYLNIGCGGNMIEGFIMLDYAKQAGVELDIFWDITKLPLPFKNQSLQGIFTEHCLEHIPHEFFIENIKEFFRILKPGGTVRIVMPDAELYVDWYNRRRKGEFLEAPYGPTLETPMMNINYIFREHGHLFLYDFETCEVLLKQAGFVNIKKEQFRQGRDPKLLVDIERRRPESLYVEASKPQPALLFKCSIYNQKGNLNGLPF